MNDNSEAQGGSLFLPSKLSLFLPTLAIVAGYGLLLSALALLGRADGQLARLCVVVLALFSPFLVAHAVLRLVTTRVAVLPHLVHLHPGFPRGGAYEIPHALIVSMRIRRGLGDRIAGSGTLVLTLASGQSVAACDLVDPDGAMLAIEERLLARPPQPAKEIAPLALPLVASL